MSALRKLKRNLENNKFLITKSTYVWAYMIYGCEDCGYKTIMFLQKGLEEHGENHKPVPFMIRCPICKNFHCKDISFLRRLPETRPLKATENYFKNDKKHDCGIPVIKQI